MDWDIIITVIGTLLGVVIGGLLSNSGQKKVLQSQINWEEKKDLIAQNSNRLRMYNKFLEADGKCEMVEPLGGEFLDFDIIRYINDIRPILFEEYHTIHSDIANIISEIDLIIRQMNLEHRDRHDTPNDYTEYYQVDNIARKYSELINKTNFYLNENRVAILTKFEN